MELLAAIFPLFSLLTIVDCVSTERFCGPETGDDFQRAHIGLIISPIMSRRMIREMEIYWKHAKYRPGDTIALYASEPTNDLVPIYTLVPNAPSGIERTGLQAAFVPTSSLTFVQQCLKYHVAWLRNGTVRLTSCLRTQPRWMAERRDILGPLPMSRIFLPGTHDSASYAIHERADLENIVERYVMTQDVDVLAQLIYGVRYLDIRVGHYPTSSSVWWANHGVFRSVPMQNVINQVKTFLDNTDEIVIFDVQEFPIDVKRQKLLEILIKLLAKRQLANVQLNVGSENFTMKTRVLKMRRVSLADVLQLLTIMIIFNSARTALVGFGESLAVHHDFVAFLEEQFAGYYLPASYGWTSTLNAIWSSGKRLVIGYDDKRVVSRYESVWPCVTHQWGNVRTVEDLFSYLDRIETESIGHPRSIPRSAMAELTANTLDVILNRLGSIRQMAERVNINVTSWYNSKWQHTANIVAVDFVRSSGIVETAIEWNERRNLHC